MSSHKKPGPSSGLSKAETDNKKPSQFQSDIRRQKGEFPASAGFARVDSPHWGNSTPYDPLPAQYAYPTKEREDFAYKQKLMRDPLFNNISKSGAARINYQVTDQDVKVMQDAEAAKRMYEYHAYLDQHFDPRIPGQLNWIMEIEPDYIKYKMSALEQKFKTQERLERLRAFGVQDQEDMRTKYLLDTGQIPDPSNEELVGANQRYVPGFFATDYRIPRPGAATPFTGIIPDDTSTLPNMGGSLGMSRHSTVADKFVRSSSSTPQTGN